jgi:hypothetical protein
MLEGTIGDTQMILVTLKPDGPVDGVPVWTVLSGNSTLLSDPTHPAWDKTLPEGMQSFLVSETLPAGELGPVDTEYEVSADVDMGAGTQHLTDSILIHVVNMASTLGLTAAPPIAKP